MPVQRFPAGSFFAKVEQMQAEGFDADYDWTEIRYPTERATLKVELPPGFLVTDVGFDVWTGDSKVPHRGEKLRLEREKAFRSGLTDDGLLYLCLELDCPIRGLTYALRWRPPGDKAARKGRASAGASRDEPEPVQAPVSTS